MSQFAGIFSESYERVINRVKDGRDFFTAFYDRVIQSSPEIAEKFKNTDILNQKIVLRRSLYHLLNFHMSQQKEDELTREARAHMEDIARRHGKHDLDISPKLYEIWLNNLLMTVAEYDEAFSPKVETAWREVMTSGIQFMTSYYQT